MRQARRILTTHSTFTETEAPIFSPPAVQRSPWHSPLPYLFGGLAAMLGLIAFALLILACSYFKKSREATESDDLEAANKSSPVFEEKIFVIMAGDMKPTFLATPVSFTTTKSPYSSTVDSQGNQKLTDNEKQNDQIEEKQKDDDDDDHHHHHQIHTCPSPVPNQ